MKHPQLELISSRDDRQHLSKITSHDHNLAPKWFVNTSKIPKGSINSLKCKFVLHRCLIPYDQISYPYGMHWENLNLYHTLSSSMEIGMFMKGTTVLTSYLHNSQLISMVRQSPNIFGGVPPGPPQKSHNSQLTTNFNGPSVAERVRIPTQDPWICIPRVARSERDGGRERRKEINLSLIHI